MYKNRYNIRPGSKWDGKNRSNNFEENLLQKIEQKNLI